MVGAAREMGASQGWFGLIATLGASFLLCSLV
jgi:hypothetical protein